MRERAARLTRWLTEETVSGVVLLIAALIALIWANSPWRDAYADLAALRVGPEALNLNLTLATWAKDGVLAIFFFVVGLELKHELRAGSLSNPREAAVPMIAAVGGMIVPALFYVAVISTIGVSSELHGWAIPTATDIAFALAVLAVFGRGLPLALRTFLLTLAVVDDLLAIIVIAVFYTRELHLTPLLIAVPLVVLYTLIARLRKGALISVLLVIACVVWWLVHESGVHATVAGVVLGFCIPATALADGEQARTEHYDRLARPWSAALALPVFAFFSAGVAVADIGVGAFISSPVAIAVISGLVIGKVVGVLGTTAIVTRVTRFRLPQGVGVRDLVGVGFLTGIGFTVSLLIVELSFDDLAHLTSSKGAILLASFLAAALAALSLRWDVRRARNRDMNRDGVPDHVTEFIGGVPPRRDDAS